MAWDLVLRGISVTVVEMSEIGDGTSGRFHGLLHSGGRYVVTDPTAAEECYQENGVLRQIVPSAIEPTGGYFARLEGDDPAFERAWMEGCGSAGIPVRAVSCSKLISEVPISKQLAAAYFVPDAVLEGFSLLHLLARAITSRGGVILERTRLTGVETSEGRVRGVRVAGSTGSYEISCDAVVNSGGPWAGEVSKHFGAPISMRLAHGVMVIFANRKVDVVINRLRRPGDGDIFVPHQSVVILGTSDVEQEDPDPPLVSRAEVRRIVALGQELIPESENWRALRAFAGVRPLYQRNGAPLASHEVSRDFTVIDHADDSLSGAFSVVGGKWTTFRLMGERTADAICAYLGVDFPSSTDHTKIETPSKARGPLTKGDPVLCECESVYRSDLVGVDGSLDEWRLRTWISMGPCQGTMCAHRARSLHQEIYGEDGKEQSYLQLREERERGMVSVFWGDGARQLALQRSLRFQSLGDPWDGK